MIHSNINYSYYSSANHCSINYSAQPISLPIRPTNTPAEVSRAFSRLTDGRAKDSEDLCGEFFKYSGDALTEPICTIINQIFLTNTPLDITLTSKLFCLNKPKGSPTVRRICSWYDTDAVGDQVWGRRICSWYDAGIVFLYSRFKRDVRVP